jgi:hypothetical protein
MNFKVVPGDAAIDDPDKASRGTIHVTKFLIGHGQVPQFDNDIRAFNIGAANLAVRQDVLLTRLRPRILLSSG